MAVSDNDAQIIIGLIRRHMATTEAVLDVVTALGTTTTTLNALLTAQAASLAAMVDGLTTQDDILEQLLLLNEQVQELPKETEPSALP